MHAVDTLLYERHHQNRPINVALVGAGNMARMIALHLATQMPGIRLAAVVNRNPEKAVFAFTEAGVGAPVAVTTPVQLDVAIRDGRGVVTSDPFIVCDAAGIDVIVDATGAVEYGARVSLRAIEGKKHIVLVNAELDSTIGPVLKAKADGAGVVITNTDGDEPGVAMNLIRYLRSVGLTPVAAGNLKGMIDPHRTPETQKAFAEKYGQVPKILTSFADGTKLSMECAVLANASGFTVGRRGMHGPKCTHVKEISGLLPEEEMLAGGLVDYALGAEPYTGAFVVVHEPNHSKMKHLAYLKMGDGPFYVFYTPYHLPHVQVASTIARAVLLHDATTAPLDGPVCEVIAISKRDLRKGELLDGVGGFTCYGVIEKSVVVLHEELLPMGLSEGCRLRKNISKDTVIAMNDVEVPSGRISDDLYREQTALFAGR